MKKTLLFLSIIYAANTHAQLGLIRPATGIAREIGRSGKPLRNVDYTLDTIRHKGETAPKQRYAEKDMTHGIGSQMELYKLTQEISALQNNLDDMYALLMAEKKIDNISTARNRLDDIEKDYPKFDRSIFEAEYAFYKRFQYVKTPEELEQDRLKEEERQKERERINEADKPAQAIVAAEDPHVITDFDRKLDSSYLSGFHDKLSEIRAHNKIMQIKEEEQKRRDDSIAVVKRMEEQQEAARVAAAAAAAEAAEAKKRQAELTKKYGAKNAKMIMDGHVNLGMTKPMCREAWGDPIDVHSTVTRNYVEEQWVYGLTTYLIFVNGALTRVEK